MRWYAAGDEVFSRLIVETTNPSPSGEGHALSFAVCTTASTAQAGEDCGEDINVSCASGLYCAFGLNWCGTPPVVGVCRPMGSCGVPADCENPSNQWTPAPCAAGVASCDAAQCVWTCG